jgi:methionyl aminopeptidase
VYTRVKTEAEIEAMRTGGQMLATVLSLLRQKVAPGFSTGELDEIAARELKALGGEAAFLGYDGFPGSICISVNDEVVHGIPSKDKVLQDGDIVSLDFGVRYKGMITDSAITVVCGQAAPEVNDLLKYTSQSLQEGLAVIKDGCRAGDIGYAIQKVLDKKGYGIVRELVGHGVGHAVHEDPNIPNYGRANTGPELKSGMTIAVEPMATLGGDGIKVDADRWTVRTRDGSLAAHFEHTILVTKDGCEILTLAP